MTLSIQRMLSLGKKRRCCSDSARRSGNRPQRAALAVELLEDRCVPATLTVNSLADNVIAGDGLVTLREAIIAANNDAVTDLGEVANGADEIAFQPGLAGTIGLELGQIEITGALTIRGLGAAQTIINARGESRIFDITSTAGDVMLEGLTLINGRTDTAFAAEGGGAIRSRSLGTLALRGVTVTASGTLGLLAHGGAIYSEFGDVTLSGGTLLSDNFTEGNTAPGGAIYVGNGNVTVIDSTLTGNAVRNANSLGGAIRVDMGNVTVMNSNFLDNSAEVLGGAINVFQGNVIISASTFSGNSAGASGGAIQAQNGAVMVTDSTFDGNSAGSGGGAIQTNDGAVTVTGSTFSGNSAIGGGGAIETNRGDVTVTGSTFTANTASLGGGIRTSSGSLTVMNSTFLDNSSRFDGGAIRTSSGSVTVTSTTFSGNTASIGGGAIASGGAAVTVTDSDFSGNSAGMSGGAIQAFDGPVTVTASIFVGNSADNGGAISTDRSNITVTDSTFTGNSAAATGGGMSTIDGDVTVRRSTFSGNRATGNGGGVSAENGNVTVVDSTFDLNQAGNDGGGIHTSLGGQVRVTSSTFSANSAGDDGGAIRAGGDVTISHSTIFANSAGDDGGGIFILDFVDLDVSQSIVAGNAASTGPDLPPFSGGLLTVRYSLIGNNQDSGLAESQTPDANGNLIGSAANPIDPRLAPLADNGGPTRTHALLRDSPAFNAGDPNFLPSVITADQRGLPRVSFGRIDIGAYEAFPDTLIVDNPVDESDGDFSPGDLSLREAVELISRDAPATQTIRFDETVFPAGVTTTILLTLDQLRIDGDADIVGPGADRIVLDAQGLSRVFEVAQDVTVRIDGLTLRGGRADVGGAVFADRGSVVEIYHSTLTGHYADYGGAIFADRGSTVTVTDSTLSDNTARFDGGGIFASPNSQVLIMNSTLTNNCAGGEGDAFFAAANSTVTVQQSTIIKPIAAPTAVLVPDRLLPGKTTLAVSGTRGDDIILVRRAQGAGNVEVVVNGIGLGTFHPTGRIVVDGGEGNDFIQVDSSVRQSAWLNGGEGDDLLIGGRGSDVLLGGPGDDHLEGRRGRDLLIGGPGSDYLWGGTESDLLLAGSTALDGDETALMAVMAEWTSGRNYAARLANLRGQNNPRFEQRGNGTVFLTAQGPDATAFDDAAADVLRGQQGRDWYFAHVASGVVDLPLGLLPNEELDDLELLPAI